MELLPDSGRGNDLPLAHTPTSEQHPEDEEKHVTSYCLLPLSHPEAVDQIVHIVDELSNASNSQRPSFSRPTPVIPKGIRKRLNKENLLKMGRERLVRLKAWLLEIEMGVVWGVAGVSIIMFVFAAIWYIDPALLTLVLQFRQAKCTTENSAYLVGISNCSWTSCRLGCTREVYKCWQVQVSFEFVSGTKPYQPPWASVSDFERGSVHNSDYSFKNSSPAHNIARLYPNVRGCGYPPELNCEQFFDRFGPRGAEYNCWVSTMDTSIAMTDLNLERAKEEVIYSLIPLFIFILFVLYAFCRLGVFSICNPLKLCPKASDTTIEMPVLTPKKLYDYKKSVVTKKSLAMSSFQASASDPSLYPGEGGGGGAMLNAADQERKASLSIPATIQEDNSDNLAMSESPLVSSSASSSKKVGGNRHLLFPDELELQQTELWSPPAAGATTTTTTAAVFEQPRNRLLSSAGGGGRPTSVIMSSPMSSSPSPISPGPIVIHHSLRDRRGGGGGGESKPARKDHEMVDLREFDLMCAAEDDIVSIRSVTSAVRGATSWSRQEVPQESQRFRPHAKKNS